MLEGIGREIKDERGKQPHRRRHPEVLDPGVPRCFACCHDPYLSFRGRIDYRIHRCAVGGAAVVAPFLGRVAQMGLR